MEVAMNDYQRPAGHHGCAVPSVAGSTRPSESPVGADPGAHLLPPMAGTPQRSWLHWHAKPR